ncbi:MAG: fluoride efflux transporter CrcB [Pseudomonadota bacterium]
MWTGFAYVAIGGAIGACLRHATNLYASTTFTSSSWPWGTFLVNLIGSILMGLVIGWLLTLGEKAQAQTLRVLLATGVLGGFTTFSAFSLEVFDLIKAGDPTKAALYAGSSLLLGVLAVAFGLWAAQKVFA